MRFLPLFFLALSLHAQTGENVLLVVNRNSPVSRQIADYYRPRRSVPVKNVCTIDTTTDEEIQWNVYEQQIEKPIADCLKKAGLVESVLYIVTTLGVPLKVDGPGSRQLAEHASVDSELALLYSKLKGVEDLAHRRLSQPLLHAPRHALPASRLPHLPGHPPGSLRSGRRQGHHRPLAERPQSRQIRHRPAIAQGRAGQRLAAHRRHAAAQVARGARRNHRVRSTTRPTSSGTPVGAPTTTTAPQRFLHFQWLPGAIAAEFVSTSARTFRRPPDNWSPSTAWGDKSKYFADSPQGLIADLLHEGATGASGNTYEPYLNACARPDYLLPAYNQGRNLAESYYLSLIYLSWQSVIVGDPLCALKP